MQLVGYLPEPVALLEESELKSDDAAEGGTDQTTLKRCFTQTPREQIDVVHMGVHLAGSG